jgi:hypothetical protein
LSHCKWYNTSPYQELYGEPASSQHCYPFGCDVYNYLAKRPNLCWKRQASGIPSIFVGLGNWQGKKAFLLYNPLEQTTIASVNVKFDPLSSCALREATSNCKLGYGHSAGLEQAQPENVAMRSGSANQLISCRIDHG